MGEKFIRRVGVFTVEGATNPPESSKCPCTAERTSSTIYTMVQRL
jgi:hypothetical protein